MVSQQQSTRAIRRPLWILLVLGLFVSLVGCVNDQIRGDDLYPDEPGFQISENAEIDDTTETRQVLDVLFQYRQAMVSKDFGTLNRLVSNDYYDNAGTTHTTEDDYGHSDLADIYELMAEYADQIRYDVVVEEVVIDGYRAHIDYEFKYAYQYRVGDQESWDAGSDVNRLELILEGDQWRIISGM